MIQTPVNKSVGAIVHWWNHHHMLHATHHISADNLWANLHLLFWLSLIPFATGWMGENHFAAGPTALYGAILFMCALAYWLLQYSIICAASDNAVIKNAIGRDIKGKLSIVLYALSIAIAFYVPIISQIVYVLVALMWLIPDRRIERALNQHSN